MEDGMTPPAAAGMQPGAAPAGQEPGMEAEAPAGYEICIRVGGDGKLSVGVESGQAEATEAAPGMEPGATPMPEEAGGQYMPVESIKEALTMALDIYRADGQMPGDGGMADAEFDAGYKSR